MPPSHSKKLTEKAKAAQDAEALKNEPKKKRKGPSKKLHSSDNTIDSDDDNNSDDDYQPDGDVSVNDVVQVVNETGPDEITQYREEPDFSILEREQGNNVEVLVSNGVGRWELLLSSDMFLHEDTYKELMAKIVAKLEASFKCDEHRCLYARLPGARNHITYTHRDIEEHARLLYQNAPGVTYDAPPEALKLLDRKPLDLYSARAANERVLKSSSAPAFSPSEAGQPLT
ncbi:hypothetical protein ACEPAF_592 [Sanghuangporus sanghuang]